eukprot:TRINITY_DN42605_c0_g1_i1.p1 TRINITY_DN42605_c0_g1~~TRINITY_DN42605_c0_g1_i1.p1  ORF type:complete len:183 (-),score=28.66 TRINITY_DN42605_c0_g1_i1:209-757(-)
MSLATAPRSDPFFVSTLGGSRQGTPRGVQTPRSDSQSPGDQGSGIRYYDVLGNSTLRPPRSPATSARRRAVEAYKVDKAAFDKLSNGQLEDRMKTVLAKDRVAFLMLRAPQSSAPSPRLKQLDEFREGTPVKASFQTTTGHFHSPATAQGESPPTLIWNKRRDRITDYLESTLQQAAIGFRK